MEEAGIDMRHYHSKNLDQYLGNLHFGINITFCDRAEDVCPTYPSLGTRLYWPFEDSASFEGRDKEKLEKFREIRDQIRERILEWLDERGIEPN
jgi:arsenate reductase